MLFLLSPAKSLDYESPLPDGLPHTTPRFVKQSAALIEVLRRKTAGDVAALMDLSDKLAELNVTRYQAWSPRFTARNSRQAILAFDGDVYDGLRARALKPDDLAWAQQHVRMLSGLYGVLRPMDRMQPYRLEMGTRLAVGEAANLYQFWGRAIADSLNGELRGQKDPVVVNLASQEYFKAVDRPALKARVVDCVFEETRDGRHQVISFMAKRARGMMARHVIEHRVLEPAGLKAFRADGYALDRAASTDDRLVFRRKAKA